MIDPIRLSRVVAVDEPLPPVWVRTRPTEPDRTERVGESIIRVGPDETLRRALAGSIDGASEVVLVASFLLSDEILADAMIRAAQRGVRVYVLTASETRLATLVREDDGFEARMVEEHKQLLDRLAGHVLLRSAEHFHAKLLVTDPASRPAGWICTANFNKALQESVELGVKLSPNDAEDLAAWFSWVFWTEAERELAGKGRLAKVGAPPGEPRRPQARRVVATARGEASLRNAALELIRSARRQVLVASYGLDADHDAVLALEARVKAGVRVTVLTRPRPAVSEAVQRLVAAGATVLAHDKLHAKAIVADGQALVMTANLQAHGLDHGFEVGVRLDAEASEALAWALNDWVQRFPWRFEPALERSQHLGEVCLAGEGLRTGRRTVEEEHVVAVAEVVAPSTLDLDGAGEPALVPPREKERFYQRIRYEWEVVPPRLPKKATELRREVMRTKRGKDGKEKEVQVKEPYDPPVYSHGGRKLVLLASPDKLAAARQLAKELDAAVVLP